MALHSWISTEILPIPFGPGFISCYVLTLMSTAISWLFQRSHPPNDALSRPFLFAAIYYVLAIIILIYEIGQAQWMPADLARLETFPSAASSLFVIESFLLVAPAFMAVAMYKEDDGAVSGRWLSLLVMVALGIALEFKGIELAIEARGLTFEALRPRAITWMFVGVGIVLLAVAGSKVRASRRRNGQAVSTRLLVVCALYFPVSTFASWELWNGGTLINVVPKNSLLFPDLSMSITNPIQLIALGPGTILLLRSLLFGFRAWKREELPWQKKPAKNRRTRELSNEWDLR